jgi:type I restriction enzyme S subunit
MVKWQGYKLNELGKVNRGKSKHRPRNEPSLFGGKYPFIQTAEIKATDFYITSYSPTYSEKGLAQSRLWKKGTLCITIAANIAETAILGIDACFPDSIIGFVANEDKSDVKFIKYHFDLLKLHLQSISQGTTQDNLSQEKLLKFTFTVPIDVKHQQRIASLLSAYDDLIEVNNQRIKLLEETARELYKEWFVRMRFPGYKKAKFVKGVPEGWTYDTCYSFADVKGGGTPSTINPQYWEGEINFFTPTDHSDSFYIFETEKKITEKGLKNSSTKLFSKYSTFITARGTVGNICLAGNDMAMNQSCFGIVSHKPVDCFYTFLFTDEMIRYLKLVASGATFDAITLNTFRNYKAPIPCCELKERYFHLASPMFSQIENLIQQNTQLRQIRDRLLPRLSSGKLEVKEK